MKNYSDSVSWAGMLLTTGLVHFFLIGIIGSIWAYLTENFYTNFYENLILLFLVPLIILGTPVIFFLRYVWIKNRVSGILDENIKVIKFLLGLKDH
jgi:hypothetical protein